MRAVADHLVGRAEELGQLDRVLVGLEKGRAASVEVRGEPGIGKTRLLAEFGARADRRGWTVLSGSASELERDLPFSVFVDAVDEFLGGLDPDVLTNLGEDVHNELSHIFPSLSAVETTHQVAPQPERYRAHRAVRALLETLADLRPLVLLLDDLHWADAASGELLGALLRRQPARPVLLVLAMRPRQVPERLSTTLERAQRESKTVRIELGALSPDEAREFLGDGVEGAFAADLYLESGGNPFYLEQLARSLARRGERLADPGTWTSNLGVPPGVAALLSEELALLSESARRFSQGAAVAGDPFEPDLAAAAAAIPEIESMGPVDELLGLDLIRTTDVPRRFRFRHPLVRRAVYESAPAGWRLSAHERCAKALAARGASATTTAHHIERSASEGDMGAVAILREAGEETLRLAPASAAKWFAAALRILPEKGPAQERVDLLFARAGALTAVGLLVDARDALLESIATAPLDSHPLRARLIRACAAVESALGMHEQARAHLVATLEDLPDSASPERVALMVELAMNGFWRADYRAMQEASARAVDAARPLGEAPSLAAALAVLALADSIAGDAGRARSNLAEAAGLVDSLTDSALAARLDAAAWLAGAELYLDRYAEADAHAARALALGRATGRGELFLVLVQMLGRVWFVRGKLAEAAELLDGGIESARLQGNTQSLVWNLFNRSVVALSAGQTDLALATAEESVKLSHDLGVGFHSAWAGVRLAGVLLEIGQPGGAVELLLGCAGGEEQSLIPGSWRAYCLELLTRGWLALDRHEEAEQAALRAAEWASAVQLPLADAWAARAHAVVHLCEGRPQEALDGALASVAAAESAGAPIEAALARTLAGRAHAAMGNGELASEQLQRAALEFEFRGAFRHRDLAERELRKLGHRIHRRTGHGVGEIGIESLTQRELEVASLVVDRMTNAEIAFELFLSQKTVESHLRNIFHKMNVSSRVELARAIERANRPDLTDPDGIELPERSPGRV